MQGGGHYFKLGKWLIRGEEVGDSNDRKLEMAKFYSLISAVIARIFTLNGSLSHESVLCVFFICIVFSQEMTKNE